MKKTVNKETGNDMLNRKDEQIEAERKIEDKNTDQEVSSDVREEINANRKRSTKIPKRYDDFEMYFAALSTGCLPSEVPETYEEAVKLGNGWKEAINEELSSLNENKTWELVDPKPEYHIIDSKWVFCEKIINNKRVKKARLVARGFKQNDLNDDVYAPVAKMTTIRMLLCLRVEYDLYFLQLDVKSAFLYGTLEVPVYMYQPKGLESASKTLVCKVNKALYGLKQSPKCWNSYFDGFMLKLGFNKSRKDPCLYFKIGIYVLIYVDDVILLSKNVNDLNKVKQELMKKFKMKEFVDDKKILFLGLEIEKLGNDLVISQKGLIKKILEKFNFTECKTQNIPLQPKLYLNTENCNSNVNLPYRELIGSLMYIMLGSRPDLCYAITYFSQYQNCYSEEHWTHLKNVLRYVKLTENYVLRYTKSSNNTLKLISYVDADFANCPLDRKSMTGFVLKINNNVIGWKTKKQNVVALSSCEAEYVALSHCVTDSLFVIHMLSEMLCINLYPVCVYEDNKSCIRVASTLETKRSKHVDVKFHFVRDCVKEHKIRIVYLETGEQLADMFTKALNVKKFAYFRDMLGLVII